MIVGAIAGLILGAAAGNTVGAAVGILFGAIAGTIVGAIADMILGATDRFNKCNVAGSTNAILLVEAVGKVDGFTADGFNDGDVVGFTDSILVGTAVGILDGFVDDAAVAAVFGFVEDTTVKAGDDSSLVLICFPIGRTGGSTRGVFEATENTSYEIMKTDTADISSGDIS